MILRSFFTNVSQFGRMEVTSPSLLCADNFLVDQSPLTYATALCAHPQSTSPSLLYLKQAIPLAFSASSASFCFTEAFTYTYDAVEGTFYRGLRLDTDLTGHFSSLGFHIERLFRNFG